MVSLRELFNTALETDLLTSTTTPNITSNTNDNALHKIKEWNKKWSKKAVEERNKILLAKMNKAEEEWNVSREYIDKGIAEWNRKSLEEKYR